MTASKLSSSGQAKLFALYQMLMSLIVLNYYPLIFLQVNGYVSFTHSCRQLTAVASKSRAQPHSIEVLIDHCRKFRACLRICFMLIRYYVGTLPAYMAYGWFSSWAEYESATWKLPNESSSHVPTLPSSQTCRQQYTVGTTSCPWHYSSLGPRLPPKPANFHPWRQIQVQCNALLPLLLPGKLSSRSLHLWFTGSKQAISSSV